MIDEFTLGRGDPFTMVEVSFFTQKQDFSNVLVFIFEAIQKSCVHAKMNLTPIVA